MVSVALECDSGWEHAAMQVGLKLVAGVRECTLTLHMPQSVSVNLSSYNL